MRNTKRWISLGLLSLMLIKVCVIPLLYLDFEIRRDYIIANLCENRNKPQLKCNGKCYLAKRLAEVEKQQQKQAEQDYVSKLLFQPMDLKTFEIEFQMLRFLKANLITYQYSPDLHPSSLPSGVFHPPSLI
ncbi:hypothetical protein [Dyadobacter luteus]|nr:hypothetical protein [Dyadobacter luteus]